ncbi:hypothetical protein [Ramlibacter sp.]|uniref:hypothetical protein n=1 Tax=Ramlibacter sp. TaxID=1917967 RepID=UPI0017B8D634|nr:hypothetical protein [Ramlibacter sp.]MBA2676089.1 hypothetical protein [Ramlibacter sp.]
MPKPNYAFAKRQRELEKKRKKEDKKMMRKDTPDGSDTPDAPDGLAAVPGAVPEAAPAAPELK